MSNGTEKLYQTNQIDSTPDVDRDYEYQRQNFYNLVERGQDAIQGILDLAQQSQHPRAYEVAGQLIKQVGDVTEKLGDLQTKMKKPDPIQIISIIMLILVLANITLFAFGRNPAWLFWLIIIIAALVAYVILPRLRKTRK